MKCRLQKNGFFKWCNAMNKYLEPEANIGKKGLIQVNVTNFKTHKTRCIGVAYKNNDRGLMLNYCPWCKSNILNEMSKSGGGK